MALQVWLPLNKQNNVRNQGLSNAVASNLSYSASGKLGGCYAANGTICNWGSGHTSNGVTVAFWHKWKGAVPTGWVTTLQFPYSGGDRRYYLATNNGHFYPAYREAGYETKFTLDDKWHHITMAVSDDGTSLSIYIDGILDGAIMGRSGFQLGGDLYMGQCYINDLRIYDHCLSPKEVKEISKGLVLHYPLNDAYVEGTTNKFTYPTPGSSCANSYGWDKTLHKDAISVSGWSSGYNSGVGNPTTVYHAHWIMMDDLPTMRFPYITNSSGQTPSWLGISGGGLNVADFPVGTKYTVSFDAKADENNSSISCGMYYKRNASENWNFYDGNIGIALTTNWKRYSITYTSQGVNAISSFYFYGTCGGSKGNRYVRNVQLEIKDHATPYTLNTRNETTVHDCSGYQNNGTIFRALNCIGDSPRYKISTHFTSSIPSRINLPSDMSCLSGNNEQTLSCWVRSYGLGSGMTQSGLIALGYGNSLFLSASDYCYRIDNGSSLGTVGANQNPHDGNWHLVTATYKSGVASIYTDGILKNSVSRTFSNRYINNGGNCIGTEVNNGPVYNLNGDISDIRMYTTALSADDIKELYNTSCIINS